MIYKNGKKVSNNYHTLYKASAYGAISGFGMLGIVISLALMILKPDVAYMGKFLIYFYFYHV